VSFFEKPVVLFFEKPAAELFAARFAGNIESKYPVTSNQ